MAPKPLEDLRRYVEQTQSQLEDPAERERALGVIERELTDTLGTVRTYRNEAQLQRGADVRNSDGAGSGASGDEAQGTTPPTSESS